MIGIESLGVRSYWQWDRLLAGVLAALAGYSWKGA